MPDRVWESSEGLFNQTAGLRSYGEQILTNFVSERQPIHHRSTYHIDLIAREMQPQSMLYDHKEGGLIIHAVKYFAVHLWAKEEPTNLVYYGLLDKAKNHESVVAY